MRVLVFCVVVALTVAAGLVRADPPAAPRTWVILIGVNKCRDARLRPLNYCVNDARLLYRVLTTSCGIKAEQVVLLTDDFAEEAQLPKRPRVMQEVERLARLARPRDTVLIFFSGHGLPDGDGNVVLATPECEGATAAASGVSVAWLKGALQKSRARKLLLLDCCYAGAATGTPAPVGVGANLPSGGLSILTGCRQDELSQEWPEARQGLFTHFLAQGLEGAADYDRDGKVDLGEVYRYVSEHVAQTARAMKPPVRQTPMLVTDPKEVGLPTVAELKGRAEPYPIRGRPQDPWRRHLVYAENYSLHNANGVWTATYRETQTQSVTVTTTDAAGRPTHVRTHIDDHRQEAGGRLPSGPRSRSQHGPWTGRTFLQEIRPGQPLVVFLHGTEKGAPDRPLPHPLAVDEGLIPEVALQVGGSAAATDRAAVLLRQLAPDANVEFLEPPTVNLARVEEGGQVLVFEGKAQILACLGTPERTRFAVTWRAEYLPSQQRLRRASGTAVSQRIVRGDKECAVVIRCEVHNER